MHKQKLDIIHQGFIWKKCIENVLDVMEKENNYITDY